MRRVLLLATFGAVPRQALSHLCVRAVLGLWRACCHLCSGRPSLAAQLPQCCVGLRPATPLTQAHGPLVLAGLAMGVQYVTSLRASQASGILAGVVDSVVMTSVFNLASYMFYSGR